MRTPSLLGEDGVRTTPRTRDIKPRFWYHSVKLEFGSERHAHPASDAGERELLATMPAFLRRTRSSVCTTLSLQALVLPRGVSTTPCMHPAHVLTHTIIHEITCYKVPGDECVDLGLHHGRLPSTGFPFYRGYS
ncbi:unnamed protein product [Ectocarpus sp. 12 AP-2014]